MARLLRDSHRNTPPREARILGFSPPTFSPCHRPITATFQEWVSLNFDLFSSGFVSTNPEPRCVTIQKIQTDPLPTTPRSALTNRGQGTIRVFVSGAID